MLQLVKMHKYAQLNWVLEIFCAIKCKHLIIINIVINVVPNEFQLLKIQFVYHSPLIQKTLATCKTLLWYYLTIISLTCVVHPKSNKLIVNSSANAL